MFTKKLFQKSTTTTATQPTSVSVTLDELLRMQSMPILQQRLNRFVKKPNNLVQGQHDAKVRGRGMEFMEVRRYQPGDDIRSIDWRITARRGQAHTKLFCEEQEKPIFLLVDQCQHMLFGSKRFFKSVTAALVVAFWAWQAKHKHDRIGGIIFSENDLIPLAPKRSLTGLQTLFNALIQSNQQLLTQRKQLLQQQTKPQQQSTATTTLAANPLKLALQYTQTVLQPSGVIYLVSDFNQLDESAYNLLTALSQHHDLVLCFIYDPLESQLPISKHHLEISNGHDILPINCNTSNLKQHQDYFNTRIQYLKSIAAQLALPFYAVDTAASYEEIASLLLC